MCEDIMNFLFATASPRESMRNLLSRKAGSLAQTALAGHRTIGGHARQEVQNVCVHSWAFWSPGARAPAAAPAFDTPPEPDDPSIE